MKRRRGFLLLPLVTFGGGVAEPLADADAAGAAALAALFSSAASDLTANEAAAVWSGAVMSSARSRTDIRYSSLCAGEGRKGPLCALRVDNA